MGSNILLKLEGYESVKFKEFNSNVLDEKTEMIS